MSHQVETDVAVRNAASGSSFKRSGAALILTAIATTLLGACSSGSGGTDVTIGSGQNSDPVTLDFPVFYVKRPVPDPETEEDLIENPRELMRFEIGADLFMRSRASPSAPETNLTAAENRRARRHSRPRGELRRHEGHLFDARKVHRERRRRGSADLEHLGVRHDDPRLATDHPVGHDRRGRARHHAALPARRPDRLQLDAPAAVARDAAR